MSQLLLSFKAGRSNRRHSTNFIDASSTKGLVEISRGEDELLHLQWKSRATGQVEDDLIIFPSEAEFLKAAGRTYVLKFSSSDQRHFFWMQDLSSQHDEALVAQVNGYLADPDYQPMQTRINEQESSITGSSSSQATVAPSGGLTVDQLEQLRSLVSQASGEQPAVHSPELTLTDVLTPSNLKPLFSNQSLLRAIFPHLPSDIPLSDPPSEATIQSIIESSQFQTGVQSLDQALSTGLLGGFVRGLGLPEEAGLGVGPFLKAISEQAKKLETDREDNMEMD